MVAERAFRGSIDTTRTMYRTDLLLAQEVLADLLKFTPGIPARVIDSTQITDEQKIGRRINKGLYLGCLPMAIDGIWPLIEAQGEAFARRIRVYYTYLISDKGKFAWGYADSKKGRLHSPRKMYRRTRVAEAIIQDISGIVNKKVAEISMIERHVA